MSRSYKKTPIVKDNSNSGHMKRIANRRVRRLAKQRMLDLPKGNLYRRLFCSYDICDYSFRVSKHQMIQEYYSVKKEYELRGYNNRHESLEAALIWWHRYYRRK